MQPSSREAVASQKALPSPISESPSSWLWGLYPPAQPCRYDSLTGVPAEQQSLAFEKGSVLFNIGALHTQIGARQDRSCLEGTSRAVEAFQRAAGEGCPDSSPLPQAGCMRLHVPCFWVLVCGRAPSLGQSCGVQRGCLNQG